MTNHNLQLLFLDWKQAFDSLDHTAMLEALNRFGLSDRMVSNIRSIYSAPTFQTKGPEGAIAEGKVGAGIRQGCPLSPYLFIIVLRVIFHDLDEELVRKGVPTNTWSERYPIYDLEYADDTLLLALTGTAVLLGASTGAGVGATSEEAGPSLLGAARLFGGSVTATSQGAAGAGSASGFSAHTAAPTNS